MMIHFSNASLTHWAMMSTFRFYAAAFWTLEKYLALFESQLLDHFLGGIAFRYGALINRHEQHNYKKFINIVVVMPTTPRLLLTGSENIVRMCDANAINANTLKMIMLMVLYIGYGLGIIITAITTNSAYKIKSHVITAQMIPQISCKKIKKPVS